MDIKPEEWPEFAKFIACSSTHNVDQWIEDGTYVCCPFSTIDKAYEAFKIAKLKSNYCDEVRALYDVDYEKENPVNELYDDNDNADYYSYPYLNTNLYDE